MDESFDLMLKKMAEKRQEERAKYFKSSEYKLHSMEIDFKCWCHKNGKFYNLGEEDFKEYKKEFDITLPFNFEMLIYEKWFGYVFEYDNMYDKWRTRENNHCVLNPNITI